MKQDPIFTPASEWSRKNVVGAGACLIGQMFGSSLLVYAALPLLLLPMTQEFGWSATAFSAVVTFLMVSGAVSGPFIGRLIDRLGARRVILWGTAAVGLLTLSLSTSGKAIWYFYLVHALLGIFGSAALGYVKVIGSLFARNRAKALALFGVEAALAGSVAPILVEAILSQHGWRAVYVVLGGLILAVLPVLYAILPDSGAVEHVDGAPGSDGAEWREAFRTPAMWLLIAAAVLGAAPRLGFMAHIVPFLSERGYDSASAAAGIAVVTLSGLAGSLLAGLLMDRFPTPFVAVPFQLCGLMSIATLYMLDASDQGRIGLIFASGLFGFTLQSHLPLTSYFLTRFFGLRAFGQIYGVAVALIAIAIGVATPLIGLIIESGSGDSGAMMLMAACLAASLLLFARLGFWTRLSASA